MSTSDERLVPCPFRSELCTCAKKFDEITKRNFGKPFSGHLDTDCRLYSDNLKRITAHWSAFNEELGVSLPLDRFSLLFVNFLANIEDALGEMGFIDDSFNRKKVLKEIRFYKELYEYSARNKRKKCVISK